MKWYIWAIIAVVIIVIIAAYINNKKKTALLNEIAANTTAPKPFNPFELTQITKQT